MDFRSEGTTRRVNLSVFLLRVLKAEHCNFLGKIAPALEPVKKIHSTLVLLLRGQRAQNPSKGLIIPLLRQKDDNLP